MRLAVASLRVHGNEEALGAWRTHRSFNGLGLHLATSFRKPCSRGMLPVPGLRIGTGYAETSLPPKAAIARIRQIKAPR